ncbi:MAG: BatA domain-containing protein [Thermoguttaceae bacterium]
MLFPSLLWFLFAAVGVVLIHLINVLRHRRVAWGAMAFLLASHRVNRTRLFWERLLLLLLRTLAVVLIVLAFAAPKLPSYVANIFGDASPKHHVVLLDDSFSMTERSVGGDSPWKQAKDAIQSLLRSGQSGETFTVLRSSRAMSLATSLETNDGDNRSELAAMSDCHQLAGNEAAERVAVLECSESATPLGEAITKLAAILEAVPHATITVVSDFRRRDASPAVLDNIKHTAAKKRFVACGIDDERANLVIQDAKLVDGVHAARVAMRLDLRVANLGRAASDAATITVRLDETALPPVNVPPLRVGESTTVQIPIRVNESGEHRIVCELPSDSVVADNRCVLVLRLAESVNVLIVASSEDAASATCLRLALAPRGMQSGVSVRVEPPTFLNGESVLDSFAVVIFASTPTLTPVAVRHVEDFVARGGGAIFFVGETTDAARVESDLYRSGNGIFPLRLTAPVSLTPDYLSRSPDVRVTPHKVFRIFQSDDDALLAAIRIDKFFGATVDDAPNVRVLATVRDSRTQSGVPLVVERDWGDGRVIAFATTADAAWNSWSRSPSFVVVMQDVVAYLAERRSPLESFLVGETITISGDAAKHNQAVQLVLQNETSVRSVNLNVHINEPFLLDSAGFWTATLKTHSGASEERLLAVSVDPREGDTSLAPRAESTSLTWIPRELLAASVWDSVGESFTLDTFWLIAIAICLAAEMIIARRV